MAHFDVLIVGAGHAGAQLAIMLRQRKFGGTIGLVSDEPEFPYERPPLSKDYLSGEKEFERIMIRPAAFWQERDIDLLLNSRVVEVNPEDKQVGLADGSRLDYGSLVWAAGGNPRRLSCTGHDLAGIHYIRNRKDVDALISELPETHKVVVIGGGYIGLEAAAVLSKLHKQVTVVEALDRVLARVAGPQLSEFYQEEHRAHGVDIRLATRVECIEGRDGSVRGVRTA
ncbi:MAG TPA: NAD(P)/FAD-dependent oxidoreductase, partial [Sphingobium sp.]